LLSQFLPSQKIATGAGLGRFYFCAIKCALNINDIRTQQARKTAAEKLTDLKKRARHADCFLSYPEAFMKNPLGES